MFIRALLSSTTTRSRIHHIPESQISNLLFNSSTLEFYSRQLSSFSHRVTLPKYKYQPCPKAGVVRQAAVLIPLCMIDGIPAVLFTLRSNALSKHKGEVR